MVFMVFVIWVGPCQEDSVRICVYKRRWDSCGRRGRVALCTHFMQRFLQRPSLPAGASRARLGLLRRSYSSGSGGCVHLCTHAFHFFPEMPASGRSGPARSPGALLDPFPLLLQTGATVHQGRGIHPPSVPRTFRERVATLPPCPAA